MNICSLKCFFSTWLCHGTCITIFWVLCEFGHQACTWCFFFFLRCFLWSSTACCSTCPCEKSFFHCL